MKTGVWMTRVLCLLLSVALLSSALPVSYAATAVEVFMSYTCADPTPGVGSVLNFSLYGTNTVVYQLMAVDPDSNRSFYAGPDCSVLIDKPGSWVFVGYGANSTDPKASGFLRVMTKDLVQLDIPGNETEEEPDPNDPRTNEMRYVDQFYNEDHKFAPSSYSMSKKLDHWLDMSERELPDRTNSGYLMLEQERYHQSNVGYTIGHGFVWLADKALNYIGSLGIDLALDIGGEVTKNAVFGNNGTKAYGYYCSLTNLLFQYKSDLLDIAEQLEKFDDIASVIGDIIELENGNLIKLAYGRPRMLFDCTVKNSKNLMGQSFTVMESTQTKGGQPAFTVEYFDGSTKTVTVNEIFTVNQSKYIEFKDTAVQLQFDDAIKDISKSRTNYDVYTNREAVDAVFNSKTSIIDDLPESQVKDLKALKKFSQDYQKCTDAIGVVTSLVSFDASIANYQVKLSDLEQSQRLLIDAVEMLSYDYLHMIDRWIAQITANDNDSQALAAALRVLRQDILDSKDATIMNLTKKDAVLTKDLMTVWKNGIEVVASIPIVSEWLKAGDKKLVSAMTKLTEKMGIHVPKVSTKFPKGGLIVIQIGGIILSAMDGKYLSFHDQVTQIYTMKSTLTETIRTLLKEYEKNDYTHEKACQIIEALNMLYMLKTTGEQIISMYYIDDLLSDIEGYGDAAQNIIWNELWDHYKLDSQEIHNRFTGPLVAVIGVSEKGQNASIPGDAIFTKEYSDQATVQRRGLYTRDYSSEIVQGKVIEPLPERFASLPDAYSVTFYKEGLGLSLEEANRRLADEIDSLLDFDAWDIAQWPSDPKAKQPADEDWLIHSFRIYEHEGTTLFFTERSYQQFMNAVNELCTVYGYEGKLDALESRVAKEKETNTKIGQKRERLFWTLITGHYINSVPMYDPATIYP